MASDPQPPSTVPTSPLHVAILLNSWRSKFLPAIRTSYVRVLAAVAPHVALTFFETAEGQFPDPGLFDLVVLSGANVDARRSYEWILRIHEFLRRLVAEYPQKKIVGICWGHQAISRMYGGEIADMDVPEVSRLSPCPELPVCPRVPAPSYRLARVPSPEADADSYPPPPPDGRHVW